VRIRTHARAPRVALAAATAAACSLAALSAGAAGERVDRAKCKRDLAHLATSGCRLLFSDTAQAADPTPIWGSIDCESDARHRRVDSGGDPHATADGSRQGNDAYRELEVKDGDDFFGERCELGRNDHRVGPTAIFDEGDRRVTFVSYRLPNGYPLGSERWQVVMQIKQTAPSANSGGTPVLELEAKRDRWRLLQSRSPGKSSTSRELWSAPAETGVWTRFAFDAIYSRKQDRGMVRAFVDLNGDGDAADPDERSPRFETYTLKKETSGGGDDGIAPGKPIPSHLRVGIYHDQTIDCGGGATCAVGVDNVQVVAGR
jgi:hypothetical protein